GAAHSPHQAPAEMLAHYRGRFDMGWNRAQQMILSREKALGVIPADTQLPTPPAEMPPWDGLDAAHKKTYARAMEAFAAELTYADEQFGRLVDFLRKTDELDNTIIIVLTDNGASGEGAPDGAYNEMLLTSGRYANTQENL